MFQHQPYLDQVIKDKHYNLVAVGKTFIYPMGIYSAKLNSVNDVKTKDVVAIPNDPSNEARALLLLQKAGLITLKQGLMQLRHSWILLIILNNYRLKNWMLHNCHVYYLMLH